MKTTLVLMLSLYCTYSHANDFDKALQGAGEALKQVGPALKEGKDQLEKSQIIKIGPRLYNHELTDENRPKPGQFWMGIVGDSSTTGAAASPKFQPNWLSLIGNVAEMIKNIKGDQLGPVEPTPAPLRVMYTEAEFDAAGKQGQKADLNLESDLSQAVDTEEYSVGYILGRKMGVAPDNIVLTGQDGKTVSSLANQFERLRQVGVGLPPFILISYVANDLCGKENFDNPVEKFAQTYEAELRAQFERIAAIPTNGQQTRVVFMAPLEVANVLTNKELLQQRVKFEGGEVSCQDIRDGKVGGSEAAKLMSNTLAGECIGVLGPTDNPEQRLNQLRALQAAQKQVLRKLIPEFDARGLPIQMEYAGSIENITFQNGDLAGDCFHPGKSGAEREADTMLANELKPK